MRDLEKKSEECNQLRRSNEYKDRALHTLTDEMEALKSEEERLISEVEHQKTKYDQRVKRVSETVIELDGV